MTVNLSLEASEIDPKFLLFLNTVGKEIELATWRQFAGKLDCSDNGRTGRRSFMNTFGDRQMMFYVQGYLNPIITADDKNGAKLDEGGGEAEQVGALSLRSSSSKKTAPSPRINDEKNKEKEGEKERKEDLTDTVPNDISEYGSNCFVVQFVFVCFLAVSVLFSIYIRIFYLVVRLVSRSHLPEPCCIQIGFWLSS
jgi:hypothetical protein